MNRRWLGIDFSGSQPSWAPGTRRSNVWIAEVRERDSFAVEALDRVSALPGDARPFRRLVARLHGAAYRAAGIDAPFSIPRRWLPGRTHGDLLRFVARQPCPDRDFSRGTDFVAAIERATGIPVTGKPLRTCDQRWRGRVPNVRSPLWCGARPGAPFTVACLTLLAHARRPVWPIRPARGDGLLVEAFPAAQLSRWHPRHGRYGGDDRDARRSRRAILATLAARGLELGEHRGKAEASADALDAVLAAFGAVAVTTGRLPGEEVEALEAAPEARVEAWVAVHA